MTDRGPLKIAAIYFFFGFTWILVSDTLVIWIATSSEQIARLQTAKGWVYVLITTVLVYVLLRIYSRRKDAAHQETIRAGELLSQALDQKKLLVKELHHRVRNNLQTILALLNLADESEPPGTVRRRVHAMADTHELAMAFSDPTAIDLREFMKRMVSTTARTPGQHAILTAEHPEPAAEPQAKLTVNQAVPLGMYLHEVLRWYEPQEAFSPAVSGAVEVKLELTVDKTQWAVEIRPDGNLSRRPSATARALCDAWATQLNGHIETTKAATTLSVPWQPELDINSETAGE